MKLKKNEPPRAFGVGNLKINHCADIVLEADEQVTFLTEQGKQYDVVRKSWGYYATPSINKRLKSFGYRTVLTCNAQNSYFIMLLEEGMEAEFKKYLDDECMRIIMWLDDLDKVDEIQPK